MALGDDIHVAMMSLRFPLEAEGADVHCQQGDNEDYRGPLLTVRDWGFLSYDETKIEAVARLVAHLLNALGSSDDLGAVIRDAERQRIAAWLHSEDALALIRGTCISDASAQTACERLASAVERMLLGPKP